MLDPDELHRTVKLEMDSGRARSHAQAEEIARGYVLQILVGSTVAQSATRQAALLTAANAGSRAFIGGVRILLQEDFAFSTPWHNGRPAHKVLTKFDGVSIADNLEQDRPVIIIGNASWKGDWPIYTTWNGWSAGVVTAAGERLSETGENALSGVLAGALAVSEAFQWVRGYKVASGRSVGLSLWSPGEDWRDENACGNPIEFLPESLWLLGLGHLGQAYAWTLGFLPYIDRRPVRIMLQDYDNVTPANESTSMLVKRGHGGRKTRLVAQALDALGFESLISERAFDDRTARARNEPRIALAGFDSPIPRQHLEGAGFSYIVDAGLGASAGDYLGIHVHTFPASRRAQDVFNVDPSPIDKSILDLPAYRAATENYRKTNSAPSDAAARCGILEVAGKSVGAAFVGCVAATLALSEVIRMLVSGPRNEAIDVTLRSPQHLQFTPNVTPLVSINPGYANAAQI